MNTYLNNYMDSITDRQSAKITDILDEVKLSKETLPAIAKSIEDLTQNAPVLLSYAQEDGKIESSPIQQSFRDVRIAIEELYELNNIVSLLMENSAMLLHSEVAALEDDLVAMEKSVKNYSFLVGDTTSFNYAYLETFSDDTGRDDMNTSPDRASLTFGPAQRAAINTQEGALVLPKGDIVSYAVTHRVVDGNATAIMRESQPRLNAYGTRPVNAAPTGNAWRAVVDAQAPITSTIPAAKGAKGAQTVLEYSLSGAAPASEIKIDPYSDTPMELIQVSVFSNKDPNGSVNLLSEPILLDQTRTFHFPMRSISKVQLVLNQPTYDRVSTMSTAEDEYRSAHEALQAKLTSLKETFSFNTEGGLNHLLFMVLTYFNSRNNWRPSVPTRLPTQYVGPAGIPALIEAIKRASRPREGIGTKGIGHPPVGRKGLAISSADFNISEFIKTMFKKKDEIYDMLAQREVAKFEDQLKRKGIYDPTGVLSPLQMIYQNGWVYRYSLGIQNVTVGIESDGFRGFHITKPLDTTGDIGEISIRTSEKNYRDPEGGLDDSVLTSVEYSVSNKSNPVNESDWIPILPVNSSIVESERLYPDDTGKCLIRFAADSAAPMFIYKNHRTLDIPQNNYLYDSLQQSIIGVRIPATAYTTEDILSITYSTAIDNTNISFANEGFDQPSLTNAYDDTGSGEGFTGTFGRNEVTLKSDPYVDNLKAADSDYTATFGMVTYQPITVRLEGGQVAINLTNYTGGDQASLPEEGYYFVQSGRSLIFNREINTPFRVYYQFLQNNVRVRTVLRCNSRDFVSPKVDSLQIKAKTRRANQKGLL